MLNVCLILSHADDAAVMWLQYTTKTITQSIRSVRRAQFTFKDGRAFAVAEPRAWNSLPDAICRIVRRLLSSTFCKNLPVHSMAALRSRCGHYILQLWFLYFFFFFPRLFSAVADWMWPWEYTWCGLNANLECRSEMYCTRFAGNTGRKNRQKSPSANHLTTISGYIFATNTIQYNTIQYNTIVT